MIYTKQQARKDSIKITIQNKVHTINKVHIQIYKVTWFNKGKEPKPRTDLSSTLDGVLWPALCFFSFIFRQRISGNQQTMWCGRYESSDICEAVPVPHTLNCPGFYSLLFAAKIGTKK
jgi:hypothetical protein